MFRMLKLVFMKIMRLKEYFLAKPLIDRILFIISPTLFLTSYNKEKHFYSEKDGFTKKENITQDNRIKAGKEIKKWTTRYLVASLSIFIISLTANIFLNRHMINIFFYILIIFIFWFSSSRIIEGVYALGKDAFSYIDNKINKRTELTAKERLCLLLKNYLEIIINFGLMYYTVQFFNFNNGQLCKTYNKGWLEIFDCVYFSFVTITTLGYGEILPINYLPKLLVIVELCCGLFLIVVTFGLYSSYGNNRT